MAELTSDTAASPERATSSSVENPQLRLVDLDKTYPGGHHALRGVSLDVADGEVVVIIGPSGCGKSTLLRTINGLEPINSGQILFDGTDLAAPGVSWPEVRRRIGMVFQSYELFPHLTVMGNLTLAPGLVAGESRADASARALKLLERVGLADRAEDYPRQLSGGQRQRVAIGRAIVRNPQVLLMDEPLSNLDAKLRNQMRAEIIKLRSRINTTFVYVTHDQTEAMTLGDRIVIMRDGFIQQIGTPQEVFNHPKNLFVAGFIGTPQMNFFPDAKLTVKDGKYVVELLGKSIVLPEDKQAALRARKQPEGTVTVGVRPVHLSLHQEGFPATIDVSEMMGSEMHLHMTVSGHDVIAVIPTAGLSLDDVRAGGTAHFTFDPELMHLFDPKTEENLFPVENSKAKV